jgi:hypothetical protein
MRPTKTQMRVQGTLVLILAMSTVGFIIMDLILFSETANVHPNPP